MTTRLLILVTFLFLLFAAATQVNAQDNHMIEPYLYATIEVEHIMPVLCEDMVITLNPKACVFEWRDCMIVGMQDSDLSRGDTKKVFDLFLQCMPVSIK